MKVVEQKPKIRKTKEELIKENEMMFIYNKGMPGKARSGSYGIQTTAGKQFQKPNLNLDPQFIKTNKKFDDIPGEASKPNLNKLKKPSTSKPAPRMEAKVERQLTDKLTNIAVDQKTMTSKNVERRIDRLHTAPKELTQKPNFGKYQPENRNPY